ncbi:MAG TPA: redoxin domain-containing protein [Fimbriimonadaceae bacterium]|nr:redoxin domain-containing protein [Fimbriimonadaceae bacterium]HRJ96763.1 redoxin domain-containing protein [Fimbriimonadaceae bacterium]
MRIIRLVALLGLVAGGAWAVVQETPYLALGEKAPPFAGKGTDGKDYDLAALTKEKPVFVVFWKERCPHNKSASELINTIQQAYAGKVQMVGVVNASGDGAKSWVDQFGLKYPLLPDQSKETIRAYKVVYSICTMQIGVDGKIVKVFEGYGADAMKQLSEAMAAVAGVQPASVDLTGAPGRRTWG